MDIDKMTSDEWLSYRRDLVERHYAAGHKLRPVIGCKQCDFINDYICFDCECNQLEKAKIK